jgi:hypothetical protein
MAQPEFVPIVLHDRIRVGERLPPVHHGVLDRPGMLHRGQPTGRQLGIAGPDQGYALKLASHLRPRLVVTPHEHVEDAIAGCVEVGLRRAAIYGRAPVVHDVELAFALFGFLGGAPEDLVAFRRPLFEEVAHLYTERRAIIDLVKDSTLKMTPADVSAAVAKGEWRGLLRLS